MDAYRLLVLVHFACGVVALGTYWTAAIAAKGRPVHRAAGKAYMLAMLGICATAAPMAVVFFARGKPGIGTFLAYLVVLVLTGLWTGWRAIRSKRDQASFRGRTYLLVAVATLASAGTVLAVGVAMGNPLLMGFSGVGLLSGIQMLWRRARPMAAGNWWLQEHYSAMVGLGAATHIAFLGIGLNRLVEAAGLVAPPNLQMLAWFGPLGLAFLAAFLLDRRYKPRRSTLGARIPT